MCTDVAEIQAERTIFNLGEPGSDALPSQRVVRHRGERRTQQGIGESAQQRAARGQQGHLDHGHAGCRIAIPRALI